MRVDGYGDCAPYFFLADQRVLSCAHRAQAGGGKTAAEVVQEAYAVLVFQSARFLGGTFPFRAPRHERGRDGLGRAHGRHRADDVRYFYRVAISRKSLSLEEKRLFSFFRLVRRRNL